MYRLNQVPYISEVEEPTSSSERLIFAQIADGDLRVFFCGILDERTEDGLVVVPNNEDFLDVADFGNCAEAVLDDGVTGDLEERLWYVN